MVAYPKTPFELFAKWHKEAIDPYPVALATADAAAIPSVRMVLLRGFGEKGFVFYGNDSSRKSAHLRRNPQAALCFYWQSERSPPRQVRVEGEASRLDAAAADAYFVTRPRGSQLSAWASLQSQPLRGDGELAARLRQIEERFADEEVPRPPFWNGWLLAPRLIEFWQRGEFRLHHRLLYEKRGDGWVYGRLYP